ncbi:MAG: UbiA family prenyltransferase [Candidatus Anstonellaceae archaeon]
MLANLKFILEWLRLSRIEHAFLSAIGVFLGMLAFSPFFNLQDIFVFLTPIFINAGSFILNDYFDIETDKENKKFNRPLVKGTINKKHAFFVSFLLLFIGVLIGFMVNFLIGLISLIFSFLAVLYNFKLKELPLVGNIVIALSMAIAFPFGYIAKSNSFSLNSLVLILFLGAFVVGFAREIIKSIQDIKGDKLARKARTLPVVLGEKTSALIAGFLFLFFCFFLASLFFIDQILKWNYFSLALLVISFAVFLVLAFKSFRLEDLELIRSQSLVGLAIVLFSLLLALIR